MKGVCKIKHKTKLIIILASIFIILAIIFSGYIILNGNYLTVYFTVPQDVVASSENIIISYSEEGIIKAVDIKPQEDITAITFESIKQGKTDVLIDFITKNNEKSVVSHNYTFVVNGFNTIIEKSPYTLFTGIGLIVVSVIIFSISILIILFCEIKKALANKEYSYRLINSLGLLMYIGFFVTILLFSSIRGLIEWSAYGYVSSALGRLALAFVLLSVPLIAILSVLLSISNIQLIKKEGYRFANTLGILISISLLAGAASVFLLDTVSIGKFDMSLILSGIVCYFECMFFSSMWCGLMAARNKPNYPIKYIIILGCGIAKDGSLPPLLRCRVDKAIEFYNNQCNATGEKAIFIPSGGQGNDECISESEAMRNYLLSCGIDNEQIIIENKSTTTYENMKFSKKIIEDRNKLNKTEGKVIFSTTNYHVFRSGIYALQIGLKCEGLGSKTKWYFWPNAFVREFIGMIFAQKKKHIITIFLIILLNIFLYYFMIVS